MKKFYTFIAAVLVAVGAMAQEELNWETYTENLVLSINGESSEPESKDFYIALQPDGKYAFRIENLVLGSGEDSMPVGTLMLSDVDVTKEANGDEKLSVNAGVVIEDGNDPAYDFWIGPLVTEELGGSVPVALEGTKRDNRVFITITIDITEVLGQMVFVTLGEPLPEVVVPDDNLEWKTFTENLVLSINGESSEPEPKEFYIALQEDGKYAFRIENLVLGSGEDSMPVGSLMLSDVDVTVDESGDENLSASAGVVITDGNDPAYDFWIGPLITEELGGSVPVLLNGTKRDDRVFITITIDITEVLGQMVLVTLGEPLPDGIAAPKANAAKKGTYTLQGVKTNAQKAGLYIVDGKKMVVK